MSRVCCSDALAKRRSCVSALRQPRCLLCQDAPDLAVQGLQAPVFGEAWDHLRAQSHRSGQVADGRLVAHQCQERHQLLRAAPAIEVTQKTAWFMMHRIRLAMHTGSFEKMRGEVEVDETFIGGRARFMHKSRKSQALAIGKVAVMGLLERRGPNGHSRVRTTVVPNTRKYRLQSRSTTPSRVGPASTATS